MDEIILEKNLFDPTNILLLPKTYKIKFNQTSFEVFKEHKY